MPQLRGLKPNTEKPGEPGARGDGDRWRSTRPEGRAYTLREKPVKPG
jgi:hypothetical protein